MTTHDPTPPEIAQYRFEVPIDAPRDRVWRALFDDINDWWPADFRMTGPDAVVSLTEAPGGGLTERSPDGAGLEWYSVQWIQPAQFTVYLVGFLAPDFGGPSVSHFKIALDSAPDGCRIVVTDAHQGQTDAKHLATLKKEWTRLFTDGLKRFAEAG